MKLVAGLVAIALLGLAAYLYVSVNVMPKQQAKDFVEEIRINLDNVKTGNYTTYGGPTAMPVQLFRLPKSGIQENFQMEETAQPRFFDGPESRTLVWRVTFKSSPVFPGPMEQSTYRLMMVDSGTRMIPSYRIVWFYPWHEKKPRR